MAMSDEDLGSMLKGVWYQPNHPINQTSVVEFDVGALQNKARQENQFKKRRAMESVFRQLETISADAQLRTTLLAKSATAQEVVARVFFLPSEFLFSFSLPFFCLLFFSFSLDVLLGLGFACTHFLLVL